MLIVNFNFQSFFFTVLRTPNMGRTFSSKFSVHHIVLFVTYGHWVVQQSSRTYFSCTACLYLIGILVRFPQLYDERDIATALKPYFIVSKCLLIPTVIRIHWYPKSNSASSIKKCIFLSQRLPQCFFKVCCKYFTFSMHPGEFLEINHL